MRQAPLTLLFCAGAAMAHGQELTPMQPRPPQPEAELVPYAALPSGAPSQSELMPMQRAVPDAAVLTPYTRPDQPEIMAGRTTGNLSGPVAALAPLPPPPVVTPTTRPPVKLPTPAALSRPVAAAGAEPLPAAPSSGKTVPVSLTDTALAANPDIPTVTRPEDQLILASVTLNGINRRSILELYQDDNQTLWLPLTPLAQLLEIPLSVNAPAGAAHGWYLAPTNTLVINMAEGKTTLGKQVFPNAEGLEKHAADLYITAAALREWLGVESNLDYSELRLILTTPQPLPGDLRARREDTWQKLTESRGRYAEPSDTLIPGYSDFSLPTLRIGASANISRPAASAAAMSTGLTLQAENDIFGTNSNLALSFAQNPDGGSGLTGGSLLLQRRFDNTSGPLGARYIGAGDVTVNPLPLSGLATQGRGVRLNNTPRNAVSNPDQFILTGPAPINWDVEVYQNQSLVAFSRIDSSGTYRFTALPLRAGRNVFRLVFYGPNGEREERRETIYLAGNLPKVGEWQYDTSVFQPGEKMLPGLPGTPSDTALVAQAQITTGLARNWAATVGAFQSTNAAVGEDTIQPERNGLSTGLRGSIGGTYLTTDALTGAEGTALQSSVRTVLPADMDLRLVQTRNIGYDAIRRDELVESQAELSVPFSLGKANLDTGYGYTRTTYQSQPARQEYTQRTSIGYGPLNATNELSLATQAGNRSLNGNLETAVHVMNTSWRAGLTYQPDSSDILRQAYLNTQLPVTERQTLNLNYTQQMTTPYTGTLSGNMYWRTGPMALGVQAQAASTGSAQLGLNMTTALLPVGSVNNLSSARWKLSQPNGTIGQGQAGVRVFADTNGNGAYDPGEAVLPDVTLSNRQRNTTAVTNAAGIATFSSLAPNTLARIELDLTSLPDIYLKPVSDTLNVKPHAGDNGILNYAVRMYGEISGQVLTPGGRPVQNLPVTLFDTNGRQVDTTYTESDGFYTFGALPLTSYTLSTVTTSASCVLSAESRVRTLNLVQAD